MTPPPEEPAQPEAEQPYVDPGAGDYGDPNQQAYVDPNQAYVDPAQQPGYVDPNQAYVDPAQQGYVDPNQVYVDPAQQGYVDPAQQGYVDPAQQGYVDPAQQGYVDPNQAYVDPNQQQAYVDPNQAYVDPAQQAAVPPAPEISQDAGVYDEAPVQPQQPAPAKKRPRGAKKKVARRGPQKRPATPRSSSRYTPPKKTYGEGFSLMTVFLSLAVLGLIALIAMVMIPRDLSPISGYPAKLQTEGVPRNLLDEAQRLMINRGKELAISETELNTYLNQRLQGDQGGMLGSLIEVKGVYVDLAPGTAEIYIERELFGFPLTMSSKVSAEQFRGKMQFRPAGWSVGKLEAEDRTVKPVKDMFLRLRSTCADEYQVLQQMHNVRFEDDKIVLDATI